jgi:hypothetical protein
MFFLERWKIKRRIRQLNKALYEGAKPPTPQELEIIETELLPLEERFSFVETGRLQRKAEPLSIEIPNENEKPDWWRTGIRVSAVVEGKLYEIETKALSTKGQRRVRKLIWEERLRITKRWAELLIPILSLIVAILAISVQRCK